MAVYEHETAACAVPYEKLLQFYYNKFTTANYSKNDVFWNHTLQFNVHYLSTHGS